MASIRKRTLKDGTEYWAVLYRRNGKQTSTSFGDPDTAVKFTKLAETVGIEAALRTVAADGGSSTAMTVQEWLTHHIDLLTGTDQNTAAKYRSYVQNDIAKPLGAIPLSALERDDVARWVQAMKATTTRRGTPPSAKTIRNKLMFLSGALNDAVATGRLASNPASGIGLPRDDDPHEPRFLSRPEFDTLHDAVTGHWQSLVRFLVVSGCRFNEATALTPADINTDEGTVRIRQSWKHGTGGYRLGATKTDGSRRTINVPASMLDLLDLSGEFVFLNRDNGPVRIHGFIRRVWDPAVLRSRLEPKPTPHDLRHTCASWMIQAGVPLPVIQKHLGHTDIRTTIGTYGHLDRSSMRAAADALEKMLA
ncbi:site-specific integrase [Mycobacteroides chelonae]|uniref:tyrosine-type recombinase/integrase n=1 Tax=Mycobacteroides chelonae TaxID=1774 RepID=UPI002DE5F551|nr:site-specific integrase [Mycobacteroides chelonae]MEC4873123.1 site-specific integrase [Mycobacteroides chelonae]